VIHQPKTFDVSPNSCATLRRRELPEVGVGEAEDLVLLRHLRGRDRRPQDRRQRRLQGQETAEGAALHQASEVWALARREQPT
jgi:hypothetical protein